MRHPLPSAIDPPVVQPDDTRAARGQFRRMGDHDQRRVMPVAQAKQQVHDRGAVLAIKIAGRFIRQQNRRARGGGTGQGHALLLAARHLAGVMIHPRAKAHGLQFGLCAAKGILAPRPVPTAGPRFPARSLSESGGKIGTPPPYDPYESVQADLHPSRSGHGPSAVTDPDVARSSPPMIIRSDDLPDPDGPTSPKLSPRWTSSEMPRKMATGPALPASVSAASFSARIGVVMKSALRFLPYPWIWGGAGNPQLVLRCLYFRRRCRLCGRCRKVLALGDSLTAGYGLPPKTGLCRS